MSVRLVPSLLSGLVLVALLVVALPDDHRVAAAEPGYERVISLARLGNDPVDPRAMWVVESYTASDVIVPQQVVSPSRPGFLSSPGDVADPLRRLSDETTL